MTMTAKLFYNGRSQAVRLPKSVNFPGSEVCVAKLGDAVLLYPKEKAWDIFMDGVNSLTPDVFADGRPVVTPSVREPL